MEIFLASPALLDTVKAEAEKNCETAKQMVGGLSESQLNWKPASDSWSMAQCLEHLAVTGESFEPFLTKAIARGRERYPAAEAVPYRPTRLGGWLLRQIDPRTTRRFPAPKVFRPSESSKIPDALEHFLRQQESFTNFVEQARGIDYNKTKLRSPVTSLMRYSLADAFVIGVVHGQRHLIQARRVRETPGFPSSSSV